MYLCKEIDGKEMCGVFPMQATMEGAKLHLGYRKTNGQTKGKTVGQTEGMIDETIDNKNTALIGRGHEFHYSSIIETEFPDTIRVEQCQLSAKGTPVSTPIYHYKNVTAGYTHWYWGDEA